MKRLFVTGYSGFVGNALQKQLASDASGIIAVAPDASLDICDYDELLRAVADAQVDGVVHLAAQSFVPDAFNDPRATFDVNFYGTLNLLRALKETGFQGRMLFVGSGDAYGLVQPDDLPLRETHPLKPRNPYAVSKVAAEALCYQWSQTDGLDIVMTRSFNHLGPGQDTRFVMADFARQVAEIKRGKRRPEIHVGDIDVSRDFTDVRDVVGAYLALLQDGRTGEVYNVCSGREVTIRLLLERLIELAGIEAEIVRDTERMRPSEQRRVCGCNEKLIRDTGWRPGLAMDTTLTDTLKYWEHISD
ncbi:MAG TPA: GDP-mannose 4,6-dehydratase [Gammaproteobacteria bacterium]|nr:GDP-mannose 4,6-dehydratase [Gammaproteobacteria bacterium]